MKIKALKKEETFKFQKKEKLQKEKDSNIIKTETKKGKEYSKLFIKILNSNKSLNDNTTNKKTKKNNEIHKIKNNIKKITLFKPEELKIQKIYSSQTSNSQIVRDKLIKKNNNNNKNKNKNQHCYSHNISKNKNKNIKYKSVINSKDKINKIPNHHNTKKIKENIKNDKQKLIQIEKHVTDNNLKLDHKYNTNKKELKNNIKVQKVDILHDNNISFEINKNKNKMKSKNDKLNYIYKQKYQKYYEVKIQTAPNLNKIKIKDQIKKDKFKKENNKSQRIITESLNIIDSFTNNNNIIKSEKKKNLANRYYNEKKKSYLKYIYTDISQSLIKLSSNNTEMNTMNSSRKNEKKSPFDLNKNAIKKTKISSKKKKLIINKSDNIKIKINQKLGKQNKHKINGKYISKEKIKSMNLNKKNNHNPKKIIRIKIKNLNNHNCETEKLQIYYPRLFFHNNTDNETGLYSEESYNSKNEWCSFINEKNNIKINRKRNNRVKKYETVRNNIDNIGQKLLILVNDFHNEINNSDNRTFNMHSRKLIDRIRAIKKLNNI